MLKRLRYLLPALFLATVASGFLWRFWPTTVSFDPYFDKDLTKLSDAEKYDLAAMLDKHLNTEEHVGSLEHPPSEPGWMVWHKPRTVYLTGARPWFFWRMKTGDGTTRLVLLEQHRFGGIPSQAYATIHVFDRQNKLLNSTKFEMGWRTSFHEAHTRFDTALDADLIEIGTTCWWTGNSITHTYFGIVQDRPVVLGAENESGHYYSPGAFHDERIGPPVPERTIEEWAQVLQSENLVLVLEAVLWLDDGQPELTPGFKECYPKSYARAERIVQLKQHSAIQRALQRLAESPHAWIKETALHVVKPKQ